jgi:hypothetical protein
MMSEFDRDQETEFVARLKNGDESAWETVYLKTVLPVLRSSTSSGISYYRIMQDRSLDEMTIYSMLYEDMICKNRLDNYRYGCPVVYWMRSYVMKLILSFCKKNDVPVSEEAPQELFIDENRKEEWELVEHCFAELWRRNPMRAYVYLLKRYEDLPSKSISELLLVSSGNVDQYFSRANQDMLEMLSAAQGGRR